MYLVNERMCFPDAARRIISPLSAFRADWREEFRSSSGGGNIHLFFGEALYFNKEQQTFWLLNLSGAPLMLLQWYPDYLNHICCFLFVFSQQMLEVAK